MSCSYWLPVLAIGGFLATTGLGQTPNSQRVAKESPPVASQAADSTESKEDPSFDAALPIRTIESAADAKHTQEREAKSDKHDAEDLDAQIRAADAAEKQISPAWAAAAITFLGTIFVYWNLKEIQKSNRISARSAKAAEDGVEVARKAIAIANRPWVGVEQMALRPMIPGSPLDVAVLVKNFGNSPALKLRCSVNYSVTSGNTVPVLPPTGTSYAVLFPQNSVQLAPGAQGALPITASQIADLQAHKLTLWVISRFIYDDQFGTELTTEMWATYDFAVNRFVASQDKDRVT